MIQTLKNDLLTVEISSHGAELQSIKDNRMQHEFLYQGNTKFWGRRSPVLFPLVGSVWEGKFRMDGKEFEMGQHGFARDCEFEIMNCDKEDEAWFYLESTDETYKKYPRRFRLEIGYRLEEARLSVMWRIKNLDEMDMPFHIGAHPAFNYPDFNAKDDIHGYLFVDRDNLHTQLLKEKGCVGTEEMDIEKDENEMIPITNNIFYINTIILASQNVRRVSLLDKEKGAYLSVLFNAPVVGIWSPSPEAPFVCIEPWYGRCDRIGFEGDFSEREYTNILSPGEEFKASYMIILERL